eukprot:gene32141-16666_t
MAGGSKRSAIPKGLSYILLPLTALWTVGNLYLVLADRYGGAPADGYEQPQYGEEDTLQNPYSQSNLKNDDSDDGDAHPNPMMNQQQGFRAPEEQQQVAPPDDVQQPSFRGPAQEAAPPAFNQQQNFMQETAPQYNQQQGFRAEPAPTYNQQSNFRQPEQMQMVAQPQPQNMQMMPQQQNMQQARPRAGVTMPAQNIASNNAHVYDTWFQFADSDKDGRVTGKDAVTFFERCYLPKELLAKVWDMANSNRKGYLDRPAFHKAMDLIALAQQGQEMNMENYRAAMSAGGLPLPSLEGFEEDSGMPELGTQMAAVNINTSTYAPTPGQFTSADSVTAAGKKNWAQFTSADSVTAAGKKNWAQVGCKPKPFDGKALLPSKVGRKPKPLDGKAPLPAMVGRKPKPFDGKAPLPAKVCTSIIDGLKSIYFQKVKPLEEAFKFSHFFSPFMNESDFDAKPSILLMGQYSTGKTTLIKYLLGQEYPGCNIGPEPTTDRFTVVYHGGEERRVPGNTLAVQPDLPYQGLAGFGSGFLTRFEGSQCPAPLLEEITIVDTPGVLSGEKQKIERHYNFVEISEWFAARCDLIFLLFDPHKLDISDEFKSVITSLRGHDDKVRIILNKADQLDQKQLMRVYGALMWSLGKVFKSPEVCRVYVGSFNSEAPISTEKNPAGKEFFESEERELLQSLYDCPQRSADRKVNEFVKRVRACKIHMLLMGHMRKQMPSMWGKDKVQKKMLEDLPQTFQQMPSMWGKDKVQEKMLDDLSQTLQLVQREHHLPIGDFPDMNRFREILTAFDLSVFPKMTPAMVQQMDAVLTVDIPKLVKQFDNPY